MSFIVAADKDRIAESEDADRGSDLTKMSRIERTDLSRRRPKISERKVRKFQARQDVIAPRMRGGRDGHSFQLVTVTAAFPPQQAGQRGGGSNRINAVSHEPLLCRLIQNHDAASAKRRFQTGKTTAALTDFLVGDTGIEPATLPVGRANDTRVSSRHSARLTHETEAGSSGRREASLADEFLSRPRFFDCSPTWPYSWRRTLAQRWPQSSPSLRQQSSLNWWIFMSPQNALT